MKTEWSRVIITEISHAVFVWPNQGKHIHKNRQFHGFVLNDENSIKDYCFSDGRVMRTNGGELFYLPKNSSYYVKTIRSGGCYAINFDAEIDDEPFCINLKDHEVLKKHFKVACDTWQTQKSTCYAAVMRAIYEGIYLIQKEREQDYMPKSKYGLITPAIDMIERDCTNRELTVAKLSELCGISDVYFRKIFIHNFGISPKEYIIRKRMEYAKLLLMLGDLEVSVIAELCGYGEPCHFSREFKRRFGVSPSDYK